MAIIAEIRNLPIVEEFLKGTTSRVKRALLTEQRRIAIDLQRYIKEQKLSGEVLKNRTGTLRRSINQRVDETPDAVIALVGVGAEASKYAAIHEFGGTIHVPEVSGKLMVFPASGAKPSFLKKKGNKAYEFKDLVFTMSHKAFNVEMPERSFMRSSLAENKAVFLERLDSAVKSAVMKKS
jgi:phage gpG-like protein